MDISNAKSFIPPILIEKGLVDIVCMSPSSFGISSVYKVTKPGVGIWIIKRIKKEFAVLYKAEMHILTQLRHDFLPIVFDIFEDEQALYIAMEFIPGYSFYQIIGSATIVSETDARKYFLQLCDLFEYLHSKDVVHKDCKPSNIMLSNNKNVYLIDFGISKSEEYNPLGKSHRYASPEQIEKPDITDPRTDIYSLGATMYSLLTKEVPSKSGYNSKAVAENLLERTDVSTKFKKIIEKCMAKNADDRFQNMGQVKAALQKRDWTWKVVASFALILVCTATMFFGFTQWIEEATERLIPRGNEMMSVSNYQLALSHYETYIRRRPWSPYGYERRRNLLLHRGQAGLDLFADEYTRFDYFLETSPEFYNTWIAAVDDAIRYHYSHQEWRILLALLQDNRVTSVIPAEENAYIQMLVYIHLEDFQAALLVGHNYNSPFLENVYEIIYDGYMARAYAHYNNDEFRTTVNLINSVLQQYPRFNSNFDMLNLRAVAMLSQLWLERSEDFSIFKEYANDALAAAGAADTAGVVALNTSLSALE